MILSGVKDVRELSSCGWDWGEAHVKEVISDDSSPGVFDDDIRDHTL